MSLDPLRSHLSLCEARLWNHTNRLLPNFFGLNFPFLWIPQGEPITFCEESFVNHRSSTMRNFLSMAVNLQLFKQVPAAVYARACVHVCVCVSARVCVRDTEFFIRFLSMLLLRWIWPEKPVKTRVSAPLKIYKLVVNYETNQCRGVGRVAPPTDLQSFCLIDKFSVYYCKCCKNKANLGKFPASQHLINVKRLLGA